MEFNSILLLHRVGISLIDRIMVRKSEELLGTLYEPLSTVQSCVTTIYLMPCIFKNCFGIGIGSELYSSGYRFPMLWKTSNIPIIPI